MRKKRTLGVKTKLTLCLSAGALALGAIAATALAATAVPIGASDNVFTGGSGGSSPTYTMDQGDTPFLTNNGPSNQHNVKAGQSGPDKGVLFFSTTTLPGQQVPVEGAQYLSAGSYPFICSIHPTEMHGTLVVTSNGTPQPRPTATLSLRTKTISKAVRKGLKVSVNTNQGAPPVKLTARLGKTTIGTGTSHQVDPGSSAQVAVIKLTKAGKSKLGGRSAAKVTITGELQFGSPTTIKGKLK